MNLTYQILSLIQQYENYIEAIIAVALSFVIASQLSRILRRRLHEKVPFHVIQNLSKLAYYIIILIGIIIAIRLL